MSVAVAIRTNVSGIGSGGEPLIQKEAKMLHIFFSVVLTNGTTNYVAGGEVLDLTQFFGTGGLPGYSYPTASLPEKVILDSIKPAGSAQSAAEFIYSYAPGTTLANGKIQVFTGAAAQAGLAELSNGNYPAGVLGDVIEGEVYLPIP
jgi:hypothetical protein